jgi:hypothetical protein
MTEQTPGQKPSTTEQILDLLLDALAERQRARGAGISPSSPLLTSPKAEGEKENPPSPRTSPSSEGETSPSPRPFPMGERELPPARPEPPLSERKRATRLVEGALRESPLVPKPPLEPGEEGWEPPARLPSIQMGRLLGRLAIVVAALVVLINIPVNSHGVSLARLLPDTASLIVRDGLVLKGPGSEIYVLEDNKLRWISSMDAFEHLGLTWNDVHVVDDAFLKQFEMGHPVSVILKCNGSPNIYALEDGKKRWIKDIDTFTAEGYVWEDVQFVECGYLRSLPDGLPIPEDAGTPPEP